MNNSVVYTTAQALFTGLLIFSLSVCTIHSAYATNLPADTSVVALATGETDKPLLDKSGKTKPAATENVEVLPDSIVPVDAAPKEQEPEKKSNTSTYVYAGIGVAAVAGIAIALGGSSGGGGSSTVTPPTVDPVGADIAGTNWSGKLLLASGKTENVTATIYQSGSVIRITTSSTLEYGKHFTGTISKDAALSMADQTTGIAWKTKNGAATWNNIDLFGLAAGTTNYDELLLYRSLK